MSLSLHEVTLINLAILTLGSLMCLVMIAALYINKDIETKQGKFFLMLVLLTAIDSFFEGASWAFDNIPGEYFRTLCIATNFGAFFVLGLALVAYAVYIHICIAMRTRISRTSLYIVSAVCVVYLLSVIISLSNGTLFWVDMNNSYHDGPGYAIAMLFPILTYIIETIIILEHRKWLGMKDTILLSSYAIIPFVALLIQLYHTRILVIYIAYYLSLMLIYMGYQAQEREKLMREISDRRAAAMLSQIQPHFLYNSLSAIENLTTKDPTQARTAIHEFSRYLRGNLDSLNENELIPFEQELQHIQHYISLEKMRFREKIQFRFEIETKDFYVPPLTVQPIIENAVRYGVGKKKAGGTVTLLTKETSTYFGITIVDDGVGFNPDIIKDDGRSHTGIENVRTRLGFACAGTLTIESKSGQGTTVTIYIPK